MGWHAKMVQKKGRTGACIISKAEKLSRRLFLNWNEMQRCDRKKKKWIDVMLPRGRIGICSIQQYSLVGAIDL
jgi:hypothetical protein